MPMMPEPIAAAINAVMATVKGVHKGGHNKFHDYDFARVEDLLEKVQPAMAEAGLFIVQDELSIGTLASDRLLAVRYAFRLAHKSGAIWADPIHQTGTASVLTPKGNLDDKCLNKAHTAARKYFITGLFQIPAKNMPDADNDGAPGEQDQPRGGRPQQHSKTPAQASAPAPRNAEPARGGYGRQRNNVDAVSTGPSGHVSAPDGEPTAETLIEGTGQYEGLRNITRRIVAAGKNVESGDDLPTGYAAEAFTLPALNDAYDAWESWWRALRPKMSEADTETVVNAAADASKKLKKLEGLVRRRDKARAEAARAQGRDPETGEELAYEAPQVQDTEDTVRQMRMGEV
jgi:hypothetical protein